MAFPFLCGGVFFFLIKEALLTNASSRDHQRGIKDDHANPIVMADLLYAFTGTQNFITAPKDVSQYKDCLSEGSINVSFNERSRIGSYDNAVKNKYSDTIRRMSEFIEWHIDLDRKEWLVKALLDVIENDAEIAETDFFYIKRNGCPVSKQDIRTMTDFELAPFLVGVLHYIATARCDQNTNGVETLDMWSTKKPRKERVYNGNAGEAITRTIRVSNPLITEDCSVQDAEVITAAPVEEKSPSDILNERILASGRVLADAWGRAIKGIADGITSGESHAESEIPEAEVVDDEVPSGAATNQSVTIIQNQTIIEHDESKTFNIKDSNVTFNL